ncbi:MAG: hypothetical protein KAT88_08685, partial [Spirochaetes bacterium]|nr:hypothetical protein [Spirochaetota bacterium]
YVEDVHSDNPHLKRYQLTKSGKTLTKQQAPFTAKFQGGPGLFPSSFSLDPRISGELQDQFRTHFRQIFKTLFELRIALGDDPSPSQIQRFLKILAKVNKQIEGFNQSIKTESKD